MYWLRKYKYPRAQTKGDLVSRTSKGVQGFVAEGEFRPEAGIRAGERYFAGWVKTEGISCFQGLG